MGAKEKTTVIGDYGFLSEDAIAKQSTGYMELRVRSIDMSDFWRRCGLLSNFGATFYAYVCKDMNKVENTFSMILNELVENAVKFSVQERGFYITNHFSFLKNRLLIDISSTTTKKHADRFQDILTEILESKNLSELYIDKLQSRTGDEKHSGMGLLLVLKDYNVKLGARLAPVKHGKKNLVEVNVRAFCSTEP